MNQEIIMKGRGTSVEDPVLFENIFDGLEGVSAEYSFISEKYGTRNADWFLELQSVFEKEGRHYDQLDIRLKDGTQTAVYFDITNFFGK